MKRTSWCFLEKMKERKWNRERDGMTQRRRVVALRLASTSTRNQDNSLFSVTLCLDFNNDCLGVSLCWNDSWFEQGTVSHSDWHSCSRNFPTTQAYIIIHLWQLGAPDNILRLAILSSSFLACQREIRPIPISLNVEYSAA